MSLKKSLLKIFVMESGGMTSDKNWGISMIFVKELRIPYHMESGGMTSDKNWGISMIFVKELRIPYHISIVFL